MKWFQYLLTLLGIVHLLTFLLDYWDNDLNFISYAFLAIAIGEIFIGLFRYEQFFFPYPELTFSDGHVEIVKNKEQQSFNWNQIQSIIIGNSSITFSLTDGTEHDIDIAYLNYGDIQTAKKEIKQRCETRDITYRSMY